MSAVVPLASTATRLSLLPDVPTVAEAALPGFDYDQRYGIVASAKSPRSIINHINGDLVRLLGVPELRERMLSQLAVPKSSTPEKFDRFIRLEVAKLRTVIMASNARVN